MDSDSPANACIAGQPTPELGEGFTSGKKRTFFPWTGRTRSDSNGRVRGHRESSASRRLPIGEGYRG